VDNKLIIGISGRKQAGKDTTCNFLKEIFSKQYSPEDVTIHSFATALKRKICIDVLCLTEEQVFGTDEQKNSLTKYKWDNLPYDIRVRNSIETIPGTEGARMPRYGLMTAREIMQVVGTDIFRDYFDQNIWVNSAMNNIENSSARVFLFSDVRFPGEADAIIDNGGFVIKLLRDVCELDIHPSESALDDYDWGRDNCFIIDNREMTIEETNDEANRIVLKILLKQGEDSGVYP